MLRDYQQTSVDKAKEWLLSCLDPCVLELATGAGKSHIVAAIAHWLTEISGGKKVLCLAPSKELIEQNREKYLKTGNPASIFSASAGRKCLRHNVVFGTELTVKNNLDRFGSRFCAVVIDECHRITPTIMGIIDHLRRQNDKLRVVGLTATPYRLGTGYIYQYGDKNSFMEQAVNPYFNRLLYRVTAHELIEKGYLTAPHADPDIIDGYDTGNLELNSRGQFDAQQVERAFEGHGRLTSQIINEVVTNSRNRMGVIIFAATRQHAKEIMSSLPPNASRLLTGETGKTERENMIADFKAQKFKYFVNVQVLTTGFDAEHIDHVVLMRRTESVALMQQMIGRGLRLHQNKTDCLVSDYAENIETHCPDGDLFNPDIVAKGQSSGENYIESECEKCGLANNFKARPNPERYEIDKNGYFVDLMGNRTDPPMPAHFGRRCEHQFLIKGTGKHYRCEYRWTLKECPECGHENDIAARYCEKCKGELVDPNEKLKADFKKLKKDPYSPTSDKVIAWNVQLDVSRAGNKMIKVDYKTECRAFPMYYTLHNRAQWVDFCMSTLGYVVETPEEYIEAHWNNETSMPMSITAYKENKDTRFYKVTGYNDEISKVA